MKRRHARLGAAAIDVAAVLIFVAAGRDSHDEDASIAGLLGVAAPFLIGLAVGWIVVVVTRGHPLSLRTGAIVWGSTLVVGLLLRRLAWDRGTAFSFIVVTALVLAMFMLGWRAIWALGPSRRAVRSPSPPSKAGR